MAYYIELFVFMIIVSYLFYKWATATYQTFSKQNIKHDKPYMLVGNSLSLFSFKESLHKLIIKQHERFKSEKIYGFYNARNPVIVLRDMDLIKKITLKDFDSFPNHKNNITSEDDEYMGSMLNALENQKWKDMRSTLTPVFTASKMRQIFELINECCSEAVKYMRQEIKPNGSEVNLKNFFTRYTGDVIASVAFGIQINSFRDKDNEFYKSGRKILTIKHLALLKVMLLAVIPNIVRVFKFNLLDVKSVNFFKNVVIDAIRLRGKGKVFRQDIIQLLIEAHKFKNDGHDTIKWTQTDIVAQCLLFFLAGFDTVGNLLCFTAYEMVRNPEIQEQLYREIVEMDKELNGSPLTYDSLKKMTYLNMVVCESLRKWPPAILTDRICTKPYSLTDASGTVLARLKPGDILWIPIIGCHYDEENFPNPYVFNPERFSPDSDDGVKEKIKNSFIPFGQGPRNCIGSRLALIEAKAILFYLFKEFKFVEGPRTVPDLFQAMKSFQPTLKDDFYIKLVPRKTVE